MFAMRFIFRVLRQFRDYKQSNFKKIPLFILVLIISSCYSDSNGVGSITDYYQTKNNDLFDLQLRGKVKSIHETVYSAVKKFGTVSKGDKTYDDESDNIESAMQFNENGNILNVRKLDFDGNLSHEEKYEYNENGIKIRYVWNNLEDDYKEEIIYKLNQDDEIFESIFSSDYGNDKTSYLYDDNGNKIEELKYDSSGKLIYKRLFEYNKSGSLIEEKRFNEENLSGIYKYNDSGKVIEESWIDYAGEITKCIYKYDKRGNNTKIICSDSDGKIVDKVMNKYNQMNDKVRSEITDEVSNRYYSSSWEYNYDIHGNWTEKIVHIYKKPTFFIERKIKYYE